MRREATGGDTEQHSSSASSPGTAQPRGHLKKPAQWFRFAEACSPFSEENLHWQIWHGLVVPRYLLRTYDNRGTERGPSFLPPPQLVFTSTGHVQALQIRKSASPQTQRLAWYRKHKYVIEHPSAQEVLTAWPRVIARKRRGATQASFEGISTRGIALFTFKQALHAVWVHRLCYATVNWLSMSPAKYQRLRADALPRVHRHLQDEGGPPLRFCKNEECQVILPAVGPRKEFCSKQCKQQQKARKRPQRTAEQTGAFVEPLTLYPESPSFPEGEQ